MKGAINTKGRRTLTDRRVAILAYIHGQAEDGKAPAVRQVADEFGIWSTAAYKHMKALAALGYLQPPAARRQRFTLTTKLLPREEAVA